MRSASATLHPTTEAVRLAVLCTGMSFVGSPAFPASPRPSQAPAQSATSAAIPARPVAEAVPASGPIRVDGTLDEEAWQAAPVLTGFVQQEPTEGAPASQRTEVRILFDDEALYIGAWLLDDEPHGIVMGERARDVDLSEGDAFVVVLDTYLDRQNGFLFGTNPLAVEHDGHVSMDGHPGGPGRGRASNPGGFNLDWDGPWSVATSRDEHGWYAEMRIPFSTLRYGSGRDQKWGLNVARHIRRNNERVFWAPVSRQYGIERVSLAGTLEGVQVPARRTMSMTPYVLQQANRDYLTDTGTRYPSNFGADAKVGLTPSVTLDVTYRTDFAQVEVDDQRIDLTRFNLFFPEKRPFFLENTGLFAIGPSGFLQLFHSRSIGIGPGGVEVPMRGGARLTGTLGTLSGGFLHIQTDDLEEVQPANRFTVARLQSRLGSRSRVGGMYTGRAAVDDPEDDNHLIVVDGRIWAGTNTFVEGYASGTRTPGIDGRTHSFYVNLDHVGPAWRPRISYMEVGEDFNPEVGFLRRSGFRVVTAQVERSIRTPSVRRVREVTPLVRYQPYYDFDGFLETRSVSVRARVQFEDGATLQPSLAHSTEGLKDPFTIHPGVVIPPGTYEALNGTIQFGTNASAPLSVGGSLDVGEFFSGTRVGGNASVALRHGGTFTGELRAAHNKIELAEGRFTTTLAALRVGVAPTPSLFLRSLVQYSSQANLWSANVRLGWLQEAGTGLFLVYNGSRSTDYPGGPLHRSFTVKFTHHLDVGR